MFDVLENHSGKICVVLVGATLVGGAVLVFGVPATIAAAYVTVHGVEMCTLATGLSAVAAGLSYGRRESKNRHSREQANARREARRRVEIGLSQAHSTLVAEQVSDENRTNIMPNSEADRERIEALEAEVNAVNGRMRRMERLYTNLSRDLARQEIDDARRSYEAGDYSDGDVSLEENEQPLLSERNMFTRRPARAPLEVAANDDTQRLGVVHRRRVGVNGSLN